MTMDKLLSTAQKGGESVREYIERFRNLSLMCPTGMPLSMLLQTCRHNFLDQVKVRMGSVKAHTWKELIEQAEITEKLAKKFETPKSMWESTTKAMIRLNLLIHQHWKYIEELDQRKVTLTRLRSIKDNIVGPEAFLSSFDDD